MDQSYILNINDLQKYKKMISLSLLNIQIYAGGACSVKNIKPQKYITKDNKFKLKIDEKYNKEESKIYEDLNNENQKFSIYNYIFKIYKEDYENNDKTKYTSLVDEIQKKIKENLHIIFEYKNTNNNIDSNELKESITEFEKKYLEKTCNDIKNNIDLYTQKKGILDLCLYSYCLYKINLKIYDFVTKYNEKSSIEDFFKIFTYPNVIKDKDRIIKFINVNNEDILIDFNDINLTYAVLDIMNCIKNYFIIYTIHVTNKITTKFPMLYTKTINYDCNKLLNKKDYGDTTSLNEIFKKICKNYDLYKKTYTTKLKQCKNSYINIFMIKDSIFEEKGNSSISYKIKEDTCNNKTNLMGYVNYYNAIKSNIEKYIKTAVYDVPILILTKQENDNKKEVKRKVIDIFNYPKDNTTGLKKTILFKKQNDKIILF